MPVTSSRWRTNSASTGPSSARVTTRSPIATASRAVPAKPAQAAAASGTASWTSPFRTVTSRRGRL